jgi:DUF4097 and DUF4098 domain-containing protein YvlB
VKSLLGSCTLLVLAAGGAGAQRVVGRADANYTVRERLGSGDRLRVATPNGEVTVSEASGSEVEVRVEKTTERGSELSDIGVLVRRVDGGLVVCAVYNDDDECDMERGYGQGSRRQGWESSHTHARLIVRVPAGVALRVSSGNGDLLITGVRGNVTGSTGNGKVNVSGTTGAVSARTGNGRVTIDGVRGSVDVNTGNGDVRVSTSSGPVSVRSGNGSIDVSMDRLERSAAMSFTTGNGRINLTVPDGFGAALEGSTGSGTITTDLPIQIVGAINPRRIRGTIGNGGEPLSIRSGSGDVQIRRR